MTSGTKVLRRIIFIDEETCNGCGACVPSCSQAAIEIVDGKARLAGERYCDGLGACLFHCPLNALSIEERWAEEFSEGAVKQHLEQRTETLHGPMYRLKNRLP